MTPLSGALAGAGGWRFLDSGPGDGAENMAMDLALLDRARRTGEPILRVYAWARPTLSFGRHERTAGRFDGSSLAAAAVDVVRRPTGGRTLLHDREVTYSVTAPVTGLSLGESYRAINTVLIAALARVGVEAQPAPRRASPLRPGTAPCFAEPNEGELTIGGAKIVGSAQWRYDGAFLQHGSILLDDDQQRIAGLAGSSAHGAVVGPPDQLPVATLGSILGRSVPYAEVRDALLAALDAGCRAAGVTSPTVLKSDSGTSDAAAAYLEHFRDAGWTWRR